MPERVKYTKQVIVCMTPGEKTILEDLAHHYRGTSSQVLRLALSKLHEEVKPKEMEINA